MQGVHAVGAFLVESAALSALRWCRKTNIDAGCRVGQLYVVSVCIAVGGELGGSWPGMLLSGLGSGFFTPPEVREGNPGEGPLWTSSPRTYKR
jgi:hypothetical protein